MKDGRIDWGALIKLTVECRVLTESQDFDVRCRSILFQNKGDGNVIINDAYTLAPNSTLQFGGTSGFHIVFDHINIKFVPGATTNRLELVQEYFADMPKFDL